MADEIAEHAPAKVNLALHVTGRRTDGYHLIETFVVFTGTGDRLTVRRAEADSFSITGPFAEVLRGETKTNLVLRVRDLLREMTGEEAAPPVAIELEKHLPVASGIGGGSSDAAAALRALTRFWGLTIPERELAETGLSLGADVPICLRAKTLVARGIGEVVEEVRDLPPLALVLVNPGVAVSTASVFGALESYANPPLPDLPVRPGFDALVDWLRQTRNDLEAPALRLAPQIGDALEALRSTGAAFSRMSGSGATRFGLFASAEEAAQAAARIAAAQPAWYVTATTTIEGTQADGAP